MNRLTAFAGVLTMSIGLSLTGCSKGTAEGDTVAVQSVAMLAGIGTVGQQNRYSGVVVAQTSHAVNKDADRTVKKLKVKEGDIVEKGDVLFTYDTDEIQMTIDMAELEIEKIKNSIESAKTEITELEKSREKAKAEDQLSYTIEIQSAQAEMKENEYTLKTKELELERLKKSKKNAKVRAEISGVIQKIDEKSEGSDSDYDYGGSDSSAYITIVEIGNYRVKGTVNETNVADIGVLEGSTVLIRSRVDAEQTWKGILGAVDTEKAEQNSNNYDYYGEDDSESSTKYPFYVTLEDSEGLMMGQHVYIELDYGQEEEQDGISISSYFLSDISENTAVVWAATDKDKLEKRTVQLGEYDEDLDTYVILEGLTAEDYIAIPKEDLKEGLPVTRYDEEYFEDDEFTGDDEDWSDDEITGDDEDWNDDEITGDDEDWSDDDATIEEETGDLGDGDGLAEVGMGVGDAKDWAKE